MIFVEASLSGFNQFWLEETSVAKKWLKLLKVKRQLGEVVDFCKVPQGLLFFPLQWCNQGKRKKRMTWTPSVSTSFEL